MNLMDKPNCYIIAGSNGAGKTTFAAEFLPHYANCKKFVNPDLIAAGLSPFDPASAMFRAGRLVLEQILFFENARVDFAFETTLSGRAYLHIIERLRSKGYRIHLFYLWVPGVELALFRIEERVKQGGHNVAETDVRRRYNRTIENLQKLYKPLMDSIYLLDNSGKAPVLIFKIEGNDTTIFLPELFERVMKLYE